MKFHPLLCCAWLLIGLVAGCQKSAPENVLTGPAKPGTLYSVTDGEGGYRVAKVTAVEEEVVMVSYYRDRWTRRPTLAEAKQATKPLPVAYKSTTFADMRPVALESAQVTAEETAQFEEWKKGAGELF